MDPRTGAIVAVKDEAEAREKGLIPLKVSEKQLRKLRAKTPEQRLAWLAMRQKLDELKAASEAARVHPAARGELTEDEHRKLKNAAKRERQARRARA